MRKSFSNNINKVFRCTVLASAFILFTCPVLAEDKTFVLVLDAGHGGKDPGAVNGSAYLEKAINLDVALRAGNLIEKNCKDVKVIYTRKTDVFVELSKRAEIANKADADLFISVHTNAARSSTPVGAETYLLGAEENRTSANLNVAMKENQAILLEDNYETTYEGFDPKSPESMIIFEFMQNEHQKESLNMAKLMQEQFIGYAKRPDRGVHQAGFLVLWKSAMPSILVELGFISNLNEAKYLYTDAGRDEMAQCIYRAFIAYLDETRGLKSANEADRLASQNAKNDAKAETKADAKTEAKAATPAASSAEQSAGPVFKIQFMTLSTRISTSDSRLKGLKNVNCRQDGKVFIYTAGDTDNYAEAQKTLKEIKTKYPDAFIIAIKDGERMSLQDAIRESGKK